MAFRMRISDLWRIFHIREVCLRGFITSRVSNTLKPSIIRNNIVPYLCNSIVCAFSCITDQKDIYERENCNS